MRSEKFRQIGGRLLLGLLIQIGLFSLLGPGTARAYPVPPLPEDNLLINPWFRSASNPSTAGLDGWTNVLSEGLGWGISQKESNPSPDIVVHGKCGFKEVYCGTGARWAAERWGARTGGDVLHPDIDVYLFQVVAADQADRQLRFLTYFVLHRVDVVEVIIYGGETADGPWTPVWTPFALGPEDTPPHSARPGREGNPWYDTGFLETVIDDGSPYYKVGLHARYPEVRRDVGEVGVKVTGVYFSTGPSNDPADTLQPALVTLPEGALDELSGSQKTPPPPGAATPLSQAPAQRARGPTAGPPAPENGQPATAPPNALTDVAPSNSPTQEGQANPAVPGNLSPFLWGGMGALSCVLLCGLIYALRKIF